MIQVCPVGCRAEEVGHASFTVIIEYGANQNNGEVYKTQDVLLLFLAEQRSYMILTLLRFK